MVGKKKVASKKSSDSKKKKTPARQISETFEDDMGGGKKQSRLIPRERDAMLEKLSEQVDELQSTRIAAAAEEQTAREALTDYMKKHKIKQYDLPGDREAILKETDPTLKALVHKKKPKKAGDAE